MTEAILTSVRPDRLSPYHNKGDPFGVYVHWPFCAAKCPYCDFNSHVRHKPVDQELFAQAYVAEIGTMATLAPEREVCSVFFGGGTPSLMEPRTVETILEAIAAAWPVHSDAEITMEANPGSVEAENFRAYRAMGVNRLSLGVQSFDDHQLKFLGRLHSADDAKKAIGLARKTFERISFDMIYARPDQSEQDWQNELCQAIDLAADHLSLYQLTIEQGTPFYNLHQKGRLKIPDEDHAAALYELTREITEAANMPAYEISNHATKGAHSRHNMIYWRYHDYAGIGPGAHGRLTVEDQKISQKIALANLKDPEKWWQQAMVTGAGLEINEALDHNEAGDEYLLMGLRLREGVSLERFARICRRQLNLGRINPLIEEGFIQSDGEQKIRVTRKGALVLDAVVAELLA